MKIKLLFTLLLLTATASFTNAQQLNIATYNIRYDSKDDSIAGNGWRARYPNIAQIIRFNELDIFGIQEGLYHQLTQLNDSLPGYKWIGAGRDDGKHGGEHSAIFYKSDKFKILRSGDFWMSTVTDKPNKGWDAALPRICSWAQFKEIKNRPGV
jgi:endonuclease/exonuclease/phosphatase family metal-dependent hydrolase